MEACCDIKTIMKRWDGSGTSRKTRNDPFFWNDCRFGQNTSEVLPRTSSYKTGSGKN
jgi:hypothetical protein